MPLPSLKAITALNITVAVSVLTVSVQLVPESQLASVCQVVPSHCCMRMETGGRTFWFTVAVSVTHALDATLVLSAERLTV